MTFEQTTELFETGCRYSGLAMLNAIQYPMLICNSLTALVTLSFGIYMMKNWKDDLWVLMGYAVMWTLFAIFWGIYNYIITVFIPLETLVTFN